MNDPDFRLSAGAASFRQAITIRHNKKPDPSPVAQRYIVALVAGIGLETVDIGPQHALHVGDASAEFVAIIMDCPGAQWYGARTGRLSSG